MSANIATMVQVKTGLNEPDFDELRDLFRNHQRWFSREVLESATEDNLLKKDQHGNFALHNNKMYDKLMDYIFQCAICAEIGMQDQWYRIILDTVGGSRYFHRRTLEEDLFIGHTGSNLLKLLPNDKTDYQQSSLNFVKKEGYVCDHCKETVIDADE